MTPTANANEATRDRWLDGGVRLVEVPTFDDVRGCLVPFEFDELPFPPRRMFVVRDVPVDTVRGRHAHLQQRQLLVCVAGVIEVEVRSQRHRRRIVLDHPQTGLLIEPGIWSSQRFIAQGSILMGLANGGYDPDDYAKADGGPD